MPTQCWPWTDIPVLQSKTIVFPGPGGRETAVSSCTLRAADLPSLHTSLTGNREAKLPGAQSSLNCSAFKRRACSLGLVLEAVSC